MGFYLFVVVIVAAGLLAWHLEGRRRDALAGVAHELGFSYLRGQQPSPAALEAAGFYLFTQGPAQILNLLEGRRGGYRIALFGYGYSAEFGREGNRMIPNSGSDGQIEQRLQSVVWLRRPGTRLPDFDLSPVDAPRRLAGAEFGLAPVTFDGDEPFRRAYRLLGRDADALRARFTPELRRRVLEAAPLYLEGRGDQWILYRHRERDAPAALPALVDEGIALIDALAR